MNAPLAFMNLGGQEMAIILVIVLLLFGAKKIPELARGLGKSMGEFKKARDEFEREIHTAADEASGEKQETKIKEVSGKEPREI
jgi:sec-independent protein translocase protein TatA